MPPDANEFYVSAMPVLRQKVKDIVLHTAFAIKYRKANADSLSQKLIANKALNGMSDNDIEGITVLILVQASKDADADIKLMVVGISRGDEQKKQQSAARNVSENSMENKNKYGEDIFDIQNAKLKVVMERKRLMAEETNAIMKKISGSQQSIINNLK